MSKIKAYHPLYQKTCCDIRGICQDPTLTLIGDNMPRSATKETAGTDFLVAILNLLRFLKRHLAYWNLLASRNVARPRSALAILQLASSFFSKVRMPRQCDGMAQVEVYQDAGQALGGIAQNS